MSRDIDGRSLRDGLSDFLNGVSANKLFSKIDASTVKVPFDRIPAFAHFIVEPNKAHLYPSEFAIQAKSNGEQASSDSRSFGLCDRYGGRGVGANGGAGRCLTINGVQIKGCGVTPLFRRKDDSTPGYCDASDCVREVIYSNIAERILPYGAAQCYGLILLNEQPSPTLGASRALLLRQPPLRPAHFLRAIRYGEESKETLVADVNRVSENCKWLLDELASHIGGSSRLERLVTAFVSLLGARLLRQIAVAKWLGFCHGSINPSNVTIAGGYVDLGTASFLPPFRNYRVAKRGYGSFDEWIVIPELLADLHHNFFYYGLEKHPGSSNLLARYQDSCKRLYRSYLETLALLAVGFDPFEVRHIPTTLRRRFYAYCQRVEEIDGEVLDLSADVRDHSPGLLGAILMHIRSGVESLSMRDTLAPAQQELSRGMLELHAQMRQALPPAAADTSRDRACIISTIMARRTELYRPVLQTRFDVRPQDRIKEIKQIIDSTTASCGDLAVLNPLFNSIENDIRI